MGILKLTKNEKLYVNMFNVKKKENCKSSKSQRLRNMHNIKQGGKSNNLQGSHY